MTKSDSNQCRPNSWYGNFKLVAGDTSMLVQMLTLGFASIGAWGGLSAFLISVGIAISYWQLALSLVVVLVLWIAFVWRIAIPSNFAAWNRQWWNNDNPARPLIEKQGRDLEAIKKHLGISDED